MNVTLRLSPFLEAFISEAVASGRFRSTEDLVLSAILLLEERERRMNARFDALHAELRQSSERKQAAGDGA